MRALYTQPAIPLFGRMRDHSSVPTNIRIAAARSGGPGRPTGRRASAAPWTGASTAVRRHRFGTVISVVSIVASSLLMANVTKVALAAPADAEIETAPTLDSWAPFVTEASRRFGVPELWIRAIIDAESAGEARALSPMGAKGLMQIMPDTWSDLRARYDLGHDPYDARDNILAGAAYIRELLDRYGAPGFLAAYNAGPGRYDDHLATGRPLPPETRAFVATLAPMISGERAADEANAAADPLAWTRAPLFIARTGDDTAADRRLPDAPPTRSSTTSVAVHLSLLAPQSDGLFVGHNNGFGRQ